jgi:quercetin dioxygenase-like cupin family protein
MRVITKKDGDFYTPPGHDASVRARKMFDPSNGCPKADMHLSSLAAGAGMQEEIHEHSDHLFYVIEGSLEVRQGGRKAGTLEQGDAIHIPAKEPHQIMNVSAKQAIILTVTIPPVG